MKGNKLTICINCKYMGDKTLGTSEMGYVFPCNVKPPRIRHNDLTNPFGSCASFKKKRKGKKQLDISEGTLHSSHRRRMREQMIKRAKEAVRND